MYGLLGEDRSDVETLTILIRRIANNQRIGIKAVGYSGCAELRRKGARQLRNMVRLGCTRFVVCHDADGPSGKAKYEEIKRLVTKPAGVTDCCVVIPVQELEAWLLADLPSATNVFTGWNPPSIESPEKIASPKEHLRKLSNKGVARPRYNNAVHNPRLAEHIDLGRVRNACPSFRPLFEFVRRVSPKAPRRKKNR